MPISMRRFRPLSNGNRCIAGGQRPLLFGKRTKRLVNQGAGSRPGRLVEAVPQFPSARAVASAAEFDDEEVAMPKPDASGAFPSVTAKVAVRQSRSLGDSK